MTDNLSQPDVTTSDLAELRGCLHGGYNPDGVNRVLGRLSQVTGLQLVCVWDYVDTAGPGGNAQFYIERKRGRLYTLSSKAWHWLSDDPAASDTTSDPGSPDTWKGDDSERRTRFLEWNDESHNYAMRDHLRPSQPVTRSTPGWPLAAVDCPTGCTGTITYPFAGAAYLACVACGEHVNPETVIDDLVAVLTQAGIMAEDVDEFVTTTACAAVTASSNNAEADYDAAEQRSSTSNNGGLAAQVAYLVEQDAWECLCELGWVDVDNQPTQVWLDAITAAVRTDGFHVIETRMGSDGRQPWLRVTHPAPVPGQAHMIEMTWRRRDARVPAHGQAAVWQVSRLGDFSPLIAPSTDYLTDIGEAPEVVAAWVRYFLTGDENAPQATDHDLDLARQHGWVDDNDQPTPAWLDRIEDAASAAGYHVDSWGMGIGDQLPWLRLIVDHRATNDLQPHSLLLTWISKWDTQAAWHVTYRNYRGNTVGPGTHLRAGIADHPREVLRVVKYCADNRQALSAWVYDDVEYAVVFIDEDGCEQIDDFAIHDHPVSAEARAQYLRDGNTDAFVRQRTIRYSDWTSLNPDLPLEVTAPEAATTR